MLGVLPQAPVAPEGLTVADLVARGRHPHQAWYRQWSSDDEGAVAEALRWTGMSEFAERAVDTLSGGQRQRVWISMVLAQGTDVVLLDEPTTFLDLAHQVDVLDLVRAAAHRGRAHRRDGAARPQPGRPLRPAAGGHEGRGDRGRGTPHEVLTAELLRAVFDLEAQVVADPVRGTPMVVPIGRSAPVRA